jgi:hypothetical protein
MDKKSEEEFKDMCEHFTEIDRNASESKKQRESLRLRIIEMASKFSLKGLYYGIRIGTTDKLDLEATIEDLKNSRPDIDIPERSEVDKDELLELMANEGIPATYKVVHTLNIPKKGKKG